jgi:hypothetical protein
MSEAIYSARANANAHIIQITEHLTIDKDDTERWTADAAERFIILLPATTNLNPAKA